MSGAKNPLMVVCTHGYHGMLPQLLGAVPVVEVAVMDFSSAYLAVLHPIRYSETANDAAQRPSPVLIVLLRHGWWLALGQGHAGFSICPSFTPSK